jgi:hypothetical protein
VSHAARTQLVRDLTALVPLKALHSMKHHTAFPHTHISLELESGHLLVHASKLPILGPCLNVLQASVFALFKAKTAATGRTVHANSRESQAIRVHTPW